MVFAGIFPTDAADYPDLRDALEKLQPERRRLHVRARHLEALGFGFRCGFLGLLHMEIIQERLEREFNLDLITTAPSVVYQCSRRTATMVIVDNPSKLPPVVHRADRRALRQAHRPRAEGVRRRRPDALRGQARHAGNMTLPRAPSIIIVYELPSPRCSSTSTTS
jgi:hypothetical protein